MTDQNDPLEANRRLVDRFLEGTHSGKLDVVDETVAENIVTHGFPGGSNPGSREQYKAFFAGFQRAFSNGAFETLSSIAEGDRVAVRWALSVDHTGEFAGVAPTGRRVRFEGVAVYRIENGRIAETWLTMDELGLLSGIGALRFAA